MSLPRRIRYDIMRAITMDAPCTAVQALMDGRNNIGNFIDSTDPELGVTPLMACAFRQDGSETLRVVRYLVGLGAGLDTPDRSGPGVTPLIMAAQEGKPILLQYLVDEGANIHTRPQNSNTRAIGFASQNDHAECVAILAKAARQQGISTQVLDCVNNKGRTSAYVAVDRCRPTVMGVLAMAGADLRRACPVYFTIHDEHLVDPSPDLVGHYSLNAAVRSYVAYSCAQCGKCLPEGQLKSCGQCNMARYCSGDCQKQNWPMHKKCCKKLRRGQDLMLDTVRQLPPPPTEPLGFQDGFGQDDEESESDDYNRDDHPVWEYNSGGPGNPIWCRYPARIEESLESLLEGGSPRYMYRPNDPEADGMSEREMSVNPPSQVATRYVYYCDMLEREIYTGAARSVRRNGDCTQPNVKPDIMF